MQKRSEAVKAEKSYFRTKLKHTALVVLCILFALSTIYAVDISTYKLLENDKDQYAMRITTPDENLLRVDFVGYKYNVDIKNIRTYANKLADKAESMVKAVQKKIQ